MRYLPQTPFEISEMLGVVGAKSVDDLFANLLTSVRYDATLNIPTELPEAALMTHLIELAAKNTGVLPMLFLGAGAYHHHIPLAVDQLLLRSEFYTAYTP